MPASDALSAIVRWGASHGLSRDDLSFLDWDSIRASRHQAIMDDMDRHYLGLADQARRSMDAAHALRLSHILLSGRDIHVATLNRSAPNFIGLRHATGAVVRLNANTPSPRTGPRFLPQRCPRQAGCYCPIWVGNASAPTANPGA